MEMDAGFSSDGISSQERERIVCSFEVWLDQALASEQPPQGLTAELLSALQNGDPLPPLEDVAPGGSGCDLYSLWSALTALTQEVRLQGRTFKQLNETLLQNALNLESFSTASENAEDEPRKRSENPQTPRPRKQEIDVLLDLRDRVERGGNTARAAAAELAPSHLPWLARWLGVGRAYARHAQEILTALTDGYALTLDSLDEALVSCRVSRIACLGLSFDPEVTVREEALATVDGKPLHLELEITREQYEDMIRPLIEQTLEHMSKALADARKGPSDLDAILLVGGSTRTPLVARMIEERTGLTPQEDIHPDLCVALGAGVLASRLAGHEVERVLVDVTPYSFGVSFLGERGGIAYPHCYKPIIRRNSPLPVTRTERFFTSHDYQEEVEVRVYEGEDEDALRNILVGDFSVKGLTPMHDSNEVLCRMSLDLDGILNVTAIEKKSGLSKHVTIDRALEAKSEAEIAAARKRLEALYATRQDDEDLEDEEQLDDSDTDVAEAPLGALPALADGSATEGDWDAVAKEGRQMAERSRGLLDQIHEEDREEVIDLNQVIEAAIQDRNAAALKEAVHDLRELLFFVEGRA